MLTFTGDWFLLSLEAENQELLFLIQRIDNAKMNKFFPHGNDTDLQFFRNCSVYKYAIVIIQ